MIKKILLVILLMSVQTVFAFDVEPAVNLNFMSEYDSNMFVKNVRNIIFSKNIMSDINTNEFKTLVKENKKDKNSEFNYLAAQTGENKFNNYIVKPIYIKNTNIIKFYTLQDIDNQRVKYVYSATGRLAMIDILYENYPYFPYFLKEYNLSGKLLAISYFINDSQEIKFNKKGDKASIIINGKVKRDIKL